MAAIIIVAIIISGISALVLLSGIALYNRLVTLRALVRSARADVEVVMGRRQTMTSGQKEALEDVLRAYNEAVWAYNTALETFPANILARWFKLRKEAPTEGTGVQTPSS